MEFEYTREERNELLKRKDLAFTLRFEGATPSRGSILGKLCALRNLNEKLVVLDSIKTTFGKMEIEGMARIYDDEESKNRTELKHMLKRGAPKEQTEA